jgi:DNA-binding phage protein
MSKSRGPITTGVLAYFRAKLQDELYSMIVRELLTIKEKLTKTELARRIHKRPEQITRWLSSPGNWTLDTVSDLCLAMDVELHCTLVRRAPIVGLNVIELFAVPKGQRSWTDEQKVPIIDEIIRECWPFQSELFQKEQGQQQLLGAA